MKMNIWTKKVETLTSDSNAICAPEVSNSPAELHYKICAKVDHDLVLCMDLKYAQL